MKAKHLNLVASAVLLTVTLLCPPVSHAVNNGNLKGPYSVLLTSGAGWSNPANMVGLLDFDGNGNVTASFETNIQGTLGSVTGSGTYSVNNNSTGSMILNLSDGSTVTYALAIDATAKQIQFAVSNEGGSSTDVISGTAISQDITEPYTFTNKSVKGAYGFLLNKVPLSGQNGGPCDIVGTLEFDGKGDITSGAGTTNLDGSVDSFTVTGSYSVNGDGTGSASLNISGGVVANFALVLNDAGKGFQLIETTTNSGGSNDVIGGNGSR